MHGSSRAPFLILETGQPVPSMRRHGGFPHWIRVAAGLGPGTARVVNVEAGDPLPDAGHFAGVLVTGSAAMVTDRHDWSERSADWLRDAAHAAMQQGLNASEASMPQRRAPRLASIFHHHAPHP